MKIKEHKMEIGHSELALKFLMKGEEWLDRGDVIPASEKLSV